MTVETCLWGIQAYILKHGKFLIIYIIWCVSLNTQYYSIDNYVMILYYMKEGGKYLFRMIYFSLKKAVSLNYHLKNWVLNKVQENNAYKIWISAKMQ